MAKQINILIQANKYLADHLAQLISLAAEGWGKP